MSKPVYGNLTPKQKREHLKLLEAIKENKKEKKE